MLFTIVAWIGGSTFLRLSVRQARCDRRISRRGSASAGSARSAFLSLTARECAKHLCLCFFRAVQDFLKGKTTTALRAHSGEDIFFEVVHPSKRGTKVFFRIACDSKKVLADTFRAYQTDPKEYAFDKTAIQVRLYALGTEHISRSQARRIVAGLEKFRSIILDFTKVSHVGQAFADEIFRVFQNAHPTILITPIHMNDAVRFMVERVGKR